MRGLHTVGVSLQHGGAAEVVWRLAKAGKPAEAAKLLTSQVFGVLGLSNPHHDGQDLGYQGSVYTPNPKFRMIIT